MDAADGANVGAPLAEGCMPFEAVELVATDPSQDVPAVAIVPGAAIVPAIEVQASVPVEVRRADVMWPDFFGRR